MSKVTTVIDVDDSLDDVILVDEENNSKADLIWADINELYTQFVAQCAHLDNSTGTRVFNKIVKPAYKQLDEHYKTSKSFEKVLSRTLKLLKNDPTHKFTHIKDLYETMKLHKVRKKVNFVTLETNLRDKHSIVYTKRKTDTNDHINDKQKVVTIDLANENPSVIDVENYNCDVILVDDGKNSEKENNCGEMSSDMLNKQEVNADNHTSPYIISEKYKANIVELYRKLCELTGMERTLVKRHEVRLKVNDGHPPGPVQRLESFLNNRIGSDGEPPFPDFNDVVQCVVTSNSVDELGWSTQQIMREATSLFTQCGRALQQRRQKREWRHLMSSVNREHFDDDPAENDPELEAKLQANRRNAIKKEAEILDRFTMIQNCHRKRCKINENANGSFQQDCDIIDNVNTGSAIELTELKSDEIVENSAEDINYNIKIVSVKSEAVDVVQELERFEGNYTTTVKDIEDPFLVIEISSDSSCDEE
ncbi:unnamed protein product, partial [Iphiclides podalirius]